MSACAVCCGFASQRECLVSQIPKDERKSVMTVIDYSILKQCVARGCIACPSHACAVILRANTGAVEVSNYHCTCPCPSSYLLRGVLRRSRDARIVQLSRTVNFTMSDSWHRAVVRPAAAIHHELQKLRPLASYDMLSGPCHGNSSHRSRIIVVGAVCSMIVRGQVLIISRPERASRLAMSIKAPIDDIDQVDRRR